MASDSRDGLEEAAARQPDTVEPYDVTIARRFTGQRVHHKNG